MTLKLSPVGRSAENLKRAFVCVKFARVRGRVRGTSTWTSFLRKCSTRTIWRPPSSSLPRVRPSTDGPERDHLISARHQRKNQTDRGCAMEVLRPPAADLAFSKIRRLTFAPQPGRPCHVTLPVRRQPLGLPLAQSAAAASTALRPHPKHAVAALATSGRCR